MNLKKVIKVSVIGIAFSNICVFDNQIKGLTSSHAVEAATISKTKKTSTKVYNNNPLKRPVDPETKAYVKYLNNDKIKIIDGKVNGKKLVQGQYMKDLDNHKYSWSDIPGKNNIAKIYKFAKHVGLKLSPHNHYYPSEKQLDKLAKKTWTSRKEKIWSRIYKKYAPYLWAERTIGCYDEYVKGNMNGGLDDWNSYFKQDIESGVTLGSEESFPIGGLDNRKKADAEYRKLAWTKYQKAVAAREKKAREKEKYHLVYVTPQGEVDVSKQFEKMIKSGVSRKDAEKHFDDMYSYTAEDYEK